jgi:transducin (beta)-like 1
MSLTSDELNYLIWRYLQESGLQVSALAMLDESTVADFDARYSHAVPIGSLVNLVQKGMLYSYADQLVEQNGEVLTEEEYGEKITMFHALGSDAAVNGAPAPIDRFEPINGENGQLDQNGNSDAEINGRDRSPEFIKVLETKFGFGEPTTVLQGHPKSSSVLAYGLTDSRAKIRVIGESESTIILNHPVQAFADQNNPSGDVTCLAWSPLGESLLTGVENGELRLWTTDGKLKNVMFLHQAPVMMIRWSPDGSHILTTDSENVSIVWDATSGHVVQHINDLKQTETPKIASSASPAPVAEPSSLGVDSEWINDNKFVIPGLNGAALVFTIGDRSPVGNLQGHTKPLSAIKFNSQNGLLLTASDDRSIRIWNGANFNSSQVLLGHSQPITFATWLNENTIISSGLDATVRVWDAIHGRQLAMAITDGIPILNSSLSSDHKKIAVGTTEGVITIFDVDLNDREPSVKNVAEYQPDIPQGEEENFMTSLEWTIDGQCVLVGYSHAESVMLSVL